MNYAIVDIGSNTIRLNIYSLEEKKFNLIISRKFTAGLASYNDNGTLSEKGILKLKECMIEISEMLKHVTVDELHAFATASLRKVSNSEIVIERIFRDTGIKIELLTEDEEARMGCIGIMDTCGLKKGISMDIGGGSAELVEFDSKSFKSIFNFTEGSLSLYTKYVKKIIPTRVEEKAVKKTVKEQLSGIKFKAKYDTLVGIGGTIRAADRILKELDMIDNGVFSTEQMKILIDGVISEDKKFIQAVLKAAPERIHTIIPGLIILNEVAKAFKIKYIKVNSNGVREGYLISKMIERY